MSSSHHVTRIVVDVRANSLGLDLTPPLPDTASDIATIDIGTSGRLLGLEIGDVWLEIAGMAEHDAHHIRSAAIPIAISADRTTIRVPRRGDGWEISFPSGNQCWRLDDGRTICSVTGST